MAKYSSKDVAFILVDGYNVRGVTTALSDSIEALLQDVTVLGDIWSEFGDTGMRKGSYQSDGFYDDAVGSINTVLADEEGVSRVICYGIAGNTIGKKFIGFQGALAGKYTRTAKLAEFHRAKGDWTVSGQVDAGVILHILQAETADGDTHSSDVDNTTSSAAGGAAYLEMSAITLDTATNLVVKVQHSADGVSWSDLATFTARTALGAERIAVNGTVNRYLAVTWAWTGGAGAGSTATFMVGFARG